MRVGLYFGSFNPPHRGHLAIAQAAIKHAKLDEVWFVVSPQNPFKTNDTLAPESDRLDMVKRVCSPFEYLKPCDIEFGMPRPNYTCNTLQLLSQQFNHAFQLIIGEDNWRVFHQWREHAWILEHYPVLVYGRKTTAAKPTELTHHANVHFIPGDYLDISASEIRERLKRGESISACVDPAVARYIEAKGLYR